MISANEARIIADQAQDARKQLEIERVERWMYDENIENDIKNACATGKYSIMIDVSQCPNYEIFNELMRDNGYVIYEPGRNYLARISWNLDEQSRYILESSQSSTDRSYTYA